MATRDGYQSARDKRDRRRASEKSDEYHFADSLPDGGGTVAEREYEDYVLAERDSDGEEPDVLLDVPVVKVDEITFEVEELRARILLQAEVLDLLKLNVGADVFIGHVGLEIKGVEAQALLKVRLDNVARILDRVLTTIDRNPQLLEGLVEGAGEAVAEIGEGAGSAVEDVGEGAGSAVEDVGEGAGEAVESTGEAVEDVGEGAGSAVEDVGEGAGEAVESTGEAVEDVGEGAGEAVKDTGETAKKVGQGAGTAAGGVRKTAGKAASGAGKTAKKTRGGQLRRPRSRVLRSSGAGRREARAPSRRGASRAAGSEAPRGDRRGPEQREMSSKEAAQPSSLAGYRVHGLAAGGRAALPRAT
jgi:hypothetical protein